MDKVLGRVQNVFKKNKKPKKKLPAGSFPNNPAREGQPMPTVTKPPDPTEDDDDDDDEAESSGNYNVPEQTQLREQPGNPSQAPERNPAQAPERNPAQVPERNPAQAPERNPAQAPERNPAQAPERNPAQAPERNPAQAPERNPSQPPQRNPAQAPERNPAQAPERNPAQAPERNSAQPPQRNPAQAPERNPAQAPERNPAQPPQRNPAQAPERNPAQAPERNPSQPPQRNPSQPAAANLTGSPFGPGSTLPSNISPNPPPPPPPPNGFFPGIQSSGASRTSSPLENNRNQIMSTQNRPMNNSNNFMNMQQRPSTRNVSSFRNRPNDDGDNVSRLELDYPIENVLIDANIPSAIAVKINDAVERDRFGKAHHVHRYTFEPSSQNLSFNNNNNSKDRHSTKNRSDRGTRHIREIHNNDQNSLFNNMTIPQTSSHPAHDNQFGGSLDQYVDQLLRRPDSTIIHAQDFNDLQRIVSQYLPNDQMISLQPMMHSLPGNNINYPAPVTYLTARALPNDPMRIY